MCIKSSLPKGPGQQPVSFLFSQRPDLSQLWTLDPRCLRSNSPEVVTIHGSAPTATSRQVLHLRLWRAETDKVHGPLVYCPGELRRLQGEGQVPKEEQRENAPGGSLSTRGQPRGFSLMEANNGSGHESQCLLLGLRSSTQGCFKVNSQATW